MNKFALVIGLALLTAGCSNKPKLEAPPCPADEKAGEAINSSGFAPAVSDDGRFTFLKFGAGQELPNFTALRLDGNERAVDHTFNPETNTVTVLGIYPTIVLRADKRVACIRNLGYDPQNPQVRNGGAVW
jgi:hypothetical protein